MFIVNVVLLCTGPILLLLLACSKDIIRLSGLVQPHTSAHPDEDSGIQENSEQVLPALKRFAAQFWNSTKLWAALAISIGLQVALIAGYVKLNPFVSPVFAPRINI